MDLAGKRVAVIGNAASAVQFVPQIAPLATELTIFQRSANWLLPRKDQLYSPRTQRRMTRWPWLAKLRHDWQWFFFGEMQLTPLMKQVRVVQWLATRYAMLHLRRQVRDPALRAKLVPDFPIGAKRVLFNDDYYPTLNRRNVRLVTDPIDSIVADGVRTKSGERFAADVIIYATGFKATDFLAPITITGAGGHALSEEWRQGARAYLGVTVSGFPNLFMLYGPNTNLGHNSILVMIEAQVGYIIDAIRQLDERGLQAPRREARRDGRVQPRAATGPGEIRLGGRQAELVQARRRHDHQQLAAQHDALSPVAAEGRSRRLRNEFLTALSLRARSPCDARRPSVRSATHRRPRCGCAAP